MTDVLADQLVIQWLRLVLQPDATGEKVGAFVLVALAVFVGSVAHEIIAGMAAVLKLQ